MQHVFNGLELIPQAHLFEVVYYELLGLVVYGGIFEHRLFNGTHQFPQLRLCEISVAVERACIVKRECRSDILHVVVASKSPDANHQVVFLCLVEKPWHSLEFCAHGHRHVLHCVDEVQLAFLDVTFHASCHRLCLYALCRYSKVQERLFHFVVNLFLAFLA